MHDGRSVSRPRCVGGHHAERTLVALTRGPARGPVSAPRTGSRLVRHGRPSSAGQRLGVRRLRARWAQRAASGRLTVVVIGCPTRRRHARRILAVHLGAAASRKRRVPATRATVEHRGRQSAAQAAGGSVVRRIQGCRDHPARTTSSSIRERAAAPPGVPGAEVAATAAARSGWCSVVDRASATGWPPTVAGATRGRRGPVPWRRGLMRASARPGQRRGADLVGSAAIYPRARAVCSSAGRPAPAVLAGVATPGIARADLGADRGRVAARRAGPASPMLTW